MKAFHEVRNYDSDFMVWHSTYSNISFMAHWHKEIELIYIRSGVLEINLTNHTLLAQEGDLIFCDRGEIHYSSHLDMDNCVDFILFNPNMISHNYITSNFCSPLITKKILQEYNLEHICKQLINTIILELKQKNPFYQDIIKSSLQEFWYHLKRHLPQNNDCGLSKNKRLTSLDEFQHLLAYIENNYQTKLQLNESAKHMHLSPCHFSRVFKKLMGMSYVSYVNLVRIENAFRLLQESSTILEVAMNCGFNNIRTFNRVFKQATGYTPSEFLNLSSVNTYNLTYCKNSTSESHIVENDSTIIINYIRNESNLLDI